MGALKRGQEKIIKRVILVESGEIFDSIALAARKYHLNEKSLYEYIKYGRKYNGFTFRTLDNNNTPIIAPSVKTKREVLCLNDMIVSDSILSASIKYNVNRQTLTRRCDNIDTETPVGVYNFCYLDEWCVNPL